MNKLILNADGTVTDYTEQDVEPVLDLARSLKRDAPMLGARFKSTFTLAAIVPTVIIEKILNEHKVNFFNKNDRPKFMKIMQTEYPDFLTLPGKVLTGKSRRGRT